MKSRFSFVAPHFLAILALTLSLLLALGSASAQHWDRDELKAFLDTAVEKQMGEHNIPNAAVAVVADGEVAIVQGYGYANLEQRRPVEGGTTMFRIGSTAKLFTWTAVMQLVEQGKLDLEADINDYLDFEIPNTLITTGEWAPPITLKHLMTHTPGFEDYMSDIFSLEAANLRPLAESVRENLPERVFPPGEVIAYSNYGASLAGYIVERTAGLPFAQYVEENILDPLQMSFSTFRQPLPDHLNERGANPYRFVHGGFREAGFEYMSEPGGSMSSSAGDMARFMLAHLQGGQLDGARILEETTTSTMQTQLFTHHSSLNGMTHGFMEGNFNGRRVLYHPGGTMLYDTVLYLLPDEQIGFFMTHSGGSHMANLLVFKEFMDQYLPAQDVPSASQTSAQAQSGAVERAADLVGEYQQNRRSFTTDDKMLSLLFGTIRIETDEQGHLLVHYLGEVHRFAELEPGVYRNASDQSVLDFGGSFDTIVFGTDPLGRTLLMMDGPVSYSRAPWYEQSGPSIIGLAVSMLFIVGSLLYWVFKAGILKLRRRPIKRVTSSHGEILARWTAVVFGILTLAVVLEFLIVSEPDPVYILPPPAYEMTPMWSAVLSLVVPWVMAITSLALTAFTVLVWKRRYWKLPSRIHYTLFSGAAILLIVLFRHWNLWVW